MTPCASEVSIHDLIYLLAHIRTHAPITEYEVLEIRYRLALRGLSWHGLEQLFAASGDDDACAGAHEARYQRGGTEKIAAAERLRVHGAMVAMSDTLSSSITSLDELSRMVDLTDETVFM